MEALVKLAPEKISIYIRSNPQDEWGLSKIYEIIDDDKINAHILIFLMSLQIFGYKITFSVE